MRRDFQVLYFYYFISSFNRHLNDNFYYQLKLRELSLDNEYCVNCLHYTLDNQFVTKH